MSKHCLHLLMVIVFTTIPSLAHRDDESPNVIPIFGEKRLEQNPLLLGEPTWRHLLQEEIEGGKPGRLLGENIKEESPVAGEKKAEDKEETGKSASANPPSMSPFSHMKKPSKGKVFETTDTRKEPFDLSYVAKPRERMPLIMRHRKFPPRHLQGEHEPHKPPHFLDDMKRPHKPPHEHKPGYEHYP
ncbi:hypothetical protein V6N13_070032 [Hibiscus sabdariffa]|uniref:Uncharacterized protein n=1 Tax=Hibiscus sabdariffa TaxID=183260 RepID=A0ABR2BJG6_9ROSI